MNFEDLKIFLLGKLTNKMILNNCYLHQKFGIFCCWQDYQIKNLLKTLIFQRIIKITLSNDTHLNCGSLQLTDNVCNGTVGVTDNVSINLHIYQVIYAYKKQLVAEYALLVIAIYCRNN